jgi:fatty aldehyde-generating acyl-ACP reductase
MLLSPPRFALIVHPIDLSLFRTYIHFLKPGKTFRDELLLKLFEWTPAYKVKDFFGISFDSRKTVDGIFLMVPFLPEMRDIRLKEVTAKIEQAISVAAQQNCTIAALGGFTSIVLQGQEKQLADKYGIALTSGNTLTAALIIRSITEICERFSISLSDQTLAIIGASGDIGSGCASYFCDKVGSLILTARGILPLEQLQKKLLDRTTGALTTTTENSEALSKASIFILATSAYGTIFDQNDFKPGSIVCDASAPQNVQFNGPLRDDIFLYHGGIAKIPADLHPDFDIGLAGKKDFYGCQIEGVLIALDPSLPCSWGRGNISPEKIDRYLAAITSYPEIRIAWGIRDKAYSEQEIAGYASRIAQCRQPEYCV